jgi:hypothetical protein
MAEIPELLDPASVAGWTGIWPDQYPHNAFSNALANSLIVSAGPCRLVGMTITNTKASAQFVLLFDTGAGSVPADGAVPVLPITVPASVTLGVDFTSVGRWFDRGLVIANSSTSATKTIGSADCWFDVQYF